jgi:hypothetical protein
MQLSARVGDLDLTLLKRQMPVLADFPLPGRVQGDLKISGVFDPELGIEKSNLKISGKLLHNASVLKWRSPTSKPSALEEKTKNSATTRSPKPRSLIPDWPMLKTAQVSVSSRIERLRINDLKAQKIKLQGEYDKGWWKGDLSLADLFSGTLALKKMQSNLLQVPTWIEATASIQNLDLQQALAWGLPAHKDLLQGRLTGSFQVKTPFPGHGDPLQKAQSAGAFKILGFEVSTLKLDEAVNSILQKIPGSKKERKFRTKNVKARLQTDYQWHNGLLRYEKTRLLTPENHELMARGTLSSDQSIQLQGRLLVNGVQVAERLQSCLLDSQGRLEVPIEYRGSIAQPQWTNARQVLAKIGKKYLRCEKKSQAKKLKSEAQKKAKQLLKKEGKKLEQKLKDKFKDIF